MSSRALKLAKVRSCSGRIASTDSPSSHTVWDMAVQPPPRRVRRTSLPVPAPEPEEGEVCVRDHLHAIEAATLDFERWKSSTTLADRLPADQIRAALKAMLFPS